MLKPRGLISLGPLCLESCQWSLLPLIFSPKKRFSLCARMYPTITTRKCWPFFNGNVLSYFSQHLPAASLLFIIFTIVFSKNKSNFQFHSILFNFVVFYSHTSFLFWPSFPSSCLFLIFQTILSHHSRRKYLRMINRAS